jgi:hypothetical protein
MYASHASSHTSSVHLLWAVPVRGNLSWVIDRFGRIPLLLKKGLPTQSTTHRLTDPWVRIQFLCQAKQWSSRLKPSFCRWQATRLIGHISLACDRYNQYLLTGTNPTVLNWHKQGLPHRNLRIATTLSPSFPSECSTGPPKWPHLVFILSNINLQQQWMYKHLLRHMVFRPLGTYRQLYLLLANSNDL